jgi:hypothetical protein
MWSIIAQWKKWISLMLVSYRTNPKQFRIGQWSIMSAVFEYRYLYDPLGWHSRHVVHDIPHIQLAREVQPGNMVRTKGQPFLFLNVQKNKEIFEFRTLWYSKVIVSRSDLFPTSTLKKVWSTIISYWYFFLYQQLKNDVPSLKAELSWLTNTRRHVSSLSKIISELEGRA